MRTHASKRRERADVACLTAMRALSDTILRGRVTCFRRAVLSRLKESVRGSLSYIHFGVFIYSF